MLACGMLLLQIAAIREGREERVKLLAENIYPLDQSKSMFEQDVPGYNRWHPDIPSVASVDPGTDFHMDCREWTDGRVDIPNACATLYISTEIFDFNVRPSGEEPSSVVRGEAASAD